MNYLDLFSGIGGFARGAELAGLEFTNHFYSDVDHIANKIYAKNFPTAIALGDIRRINGKELKAKYGEEWIICGGFPCQDISDSGSRRGINATRSGLWWEYHRLLCELRPQVAVIENVPALRYRGLERVLCSLAAIGYDAEWTLLSARQFGAPHIRKRLYIAATPADSHRNRQRPWQSEASAANTDMGKIVEPVLPSEGNGFWSSWAGRWQGDTIDTSPIALRVDDGISDWSHDFARVKACGNAVVPQCVEYVFRNLIRAGYILQKDEKCEL